MRGASAGRTVTGPVALTAAVDRGRHLSEWALVQASIRARLFGMPLLRLDASVVLMPAAITASSSRLASGTSLAEAVRSIDDGAEPLARVRRDGHLPASR
jgi:hypothetical protein